MTCLANQLKIPVIRSSNTESTALGAAYLAGLAGGVWETVKEIEDLWLGDEPFFPDSNDTSGDEMYQMWLGVLGKSRR